MFCGAYGSVNASSRPREPTWPAAEHLSSCCLVTVEALTQNASYAAGVVDRRALAWQGRHFRRPRAPEAATERPEPPQLQKRLDGQMCPRRARRLGLIVGQVAPSRARVSMHD